MNDSRAVDQILERELELLFQRKLRSNPSRHFWPIITGKLGDQVSRRPWEWIMDSVGVPAFSPLSRNFYRVAAVAIVAIIAIVFAVLINTGGDDQTDPVASSPDLGSESSIDILPTAGPLNTIATVTIEPTPDYSGAEGYAGKKLLALELGEKSRMALSTVRDFIALTGQNRGNEANLQVEKIRELFDEQEQLIAALIRALSDTANSNLVGQAQITQAAIPEIRANVEELIAKIVEDPIASARIFGSIERDTEKLRSQIDSLNTGILLAAQQAEKSEYLDAQEAGSQVRNRHSR